MYVKVNVIAGARKEIFKAKSAPARNAGSIATAGGDHFDISVKEKAERNMANSRVIELVAGHFKVPTKSVRIINGHHHPSKLLVVDLE